MEHAVAKCSKVDIMCEAITTPALLDFGSKVMLFGQSHVEKVLETPN